MFVSKVRPFISGLSRQGLRVMARTMSAAANSTNAVGHDSPGYETLAVSVPSPYVYHVRLNRPDRLNALNGAMWRDIRQAFNDISDDAKCRVVILSGEGRMFSAGLDFVDMSSMAGDLSGEDDVARRCRALYNKIREYQGSFTAIEKCKKPVISAIHGACIGGGVDMISAADIRLCSQDAWFQIKEIDIGMAADVGTLQRLPKAIGSRSLVNELALTARVMRSQEALSCGLVSKVFESPERLITGALEMAITIASKSPVAVQLTKHSLLFSRDHSVDEGLEHIASWNQTMLQSEDFMTAVMATANKNPQPNFSKL